MQIRAWADWTPLIQEFVAHWTKYGAAKEVAGKTLAEFQTAAAELKTHMDTCAALEHDLELEARQRDSSAETLYEAMKSYSDGVKAAEGRTSAHAETLPRLSPRRRSSANDSDAPQPPTV